MCLLTTTSSPYACDPVAIKVGPSLATYWVPKQLLSSSQWSTTDAGGTIHLPDISAETGHTLAHYLYTGTYHTLEANGEDATLPVHSKFKQAWLTLSLAFTYELRGLEKLAREQIELHGSQMSLAEVLKSMEQDFSGVSCSWSNEYLQSRVREQFDLDHTILTSEAFFESVGEGALHKLITRYVLQLFSAQHTKHVRCCLEATEMSFEFPKASCKDMDDVISLDSVSDPDCAIAERCVEKGPNLEVRDANEDQVVEASVATEPYEELCEPTAPIEVEQQESEHDMRTFEQAGDVSVPAEDLPVEDDAWGFDVRSTKVKKGWKRVTAVKDTLHEAEPLQAPEH